MKNTVKGLLLLPIYLVSLVACDKSKIPTDSNGNATDFSKQFKDDCNDAFQTVIPFIPCKTYTYEKGTDIYGDPVMDVYFSYRELDTMNRAYNYYAKLCEDAGYEVNSGYYLSYECIYADKVINDHDAVELVIMTNDNVKDPMLGVFCSYYLYEDKNVYPTVAVEKLLGDKAQYVPKIEGNGYQYTFYFDYEELEDGSLYKALRIYVYNGSWEDEQDYFNGLREKGYIIYDDLTIEDEDAQPVTEYPGWTGTAYDGYLYSKFGKFMLGTYFTFNSYYNALIIDIFTFE